MKTYLGYSLPGLWTILVRLVEQIKVKDGEFHLQYSRTTMTAV